MADSVGLPVLLELRVRGSVHVFQLAAGDERAVTVGSALSADLRLAEAGVAPVHFHFEREGDEVWLMPTASVGRLRLDSSRVDAKSRLNRRCVVEVAAFTIEVRWGEQSEVPAEWLKTQALDKTVIAAIAQGTRSGRMDVAYARQLPGEGDTTLIGYGALDTAREASFPTERVPVLSPRTRQLVTERIPVIVAPPTSEALSPPSEGLTGQVEQTSRPAPTAAHASVGRRMAGVSSIFSAGRLLCLVTRLGMATQQHPARVLAIALAVSLTLGAIAAE